MSKLTHMDEKGKATMVDVSAKGVTQRIARASGKVTMRPETVAMVLKHQTPKGDPLEAARLAGIMAAKRTAELIPLCHPLLIEHLDVTAKLVDDGVELASSVVITGKTGAEMEALTAVSVAALTIYDMCKAIDREMTIGRIRLEEKSGGKSGTFIRDNR
ncbi:MAG: cyclic pyranopterin monophosphate synthase MoaC [Proteobacteria bacterium]|nr:cyclic pyranopterin monophosphate synthase MoaC [Pseudomonadota bacterium]